MLPKQQISRDVCTHNVWGETIHLSAGTPVARRYPTTSDNLHVDVIVTINGNEVHCTVPYDAVESVPEEPEDIEMVETNPWIGAKNMSEEIARMRAEASPELLAKIDHYLGLEYPYCIIKLAPESGGGYHACIPMLGAWTFNGDGDTLEEAVTSLECLFRYLVHDLLTDGVDLPEPEGDLSLLTWQTAKESSLVRVRRLLLGSDAIPHQGKINQHISNLDTFVNQYGLIEVVETLASMLHAGATFDHAVGVPHHVSNMKSVLAMDLENLAELLNSRLNHFQESLSKEEDDAVL